MKNEKIIILLNVEVEIFNYYRSLSQLEAEKKYGEEFTNLISLLKNAIKGQNEILDILSVEELKEATSSFYVSFLECNFDDINYDKVISRLNILCNDRLVLSNLIDDTRRQRMGAENIVNGEFTNIQLSFVDEYLSQVDKLAVRKKISYYKYSLVYTKGATIEESLLDNYYRIDKSIYLTADLEASLKNISSYYVESSWKDLINSIINDNFLLIYDTITITRPSDIVNCSGVSLRNNVYFLNLLDAYVSFRSFSLLQSEREFIETLMAFRINKNNPWYNVLLSDRERHKTVSMGTGIAR